MIATVPCIHAHIHFKIIPYGQKQAVFGVMCYVILLLFTVMSKLTCYFHKTSNLTEVTLLSNATRYFEYKLANYIRKRRLLGIILNTFFLGT